eukprot:9256868-Pyramimonas_sp.AAC.1
MGRDTRRWGWLVRAFAGKAQTREPDDRESSGEADGPWLTPPPWFWALVFRMPRREGGDLADGAERNEFQGRS